jgi:hypothetical protein
MLRVEVENLIESPEGEGKGDCDAQRGGFASRKVAAFPLVERKWLTCVNRSPNGALVAGSDCLQHA